MNLACIPNALNRFHFVPAVAPKLWECLQKLHEAVLFCQFDAWCVLLLVACLLIDTLAGTSSKPGYHHLPLCSFGLCAHAGALQCLKRADSKEPSIAWMEGSKHSTSNSHFISVYQVLLRTLCQSWHTLAGQEAGDIDIIRDKYVPEPDEENLSKLHRVSSDSLPDMTFVELLPS